MKTSYCKAKGRRLQQAVCAALLSLFPELEPDDITSRGMGQQGVDVVLTPAARKVLGHLAIECKNKETLNVTTTFKQHASKYPNDIPLLVHSRNRSETLCTVSLSHYLELLVSWRAAQSAERRRKA
jgi:hypothetical protein